MWKSVGWHRHNVRYCSWEVWADLERERDFSGDLINMRLIITPTSSALGKRFSKIPWIRATILTGSGRGSRGECGRHIIDSTVQSSTLHFVMFVSSLALVGRSSEMIYSIMVHTLYCEGNSSNSTCYLRVQMMRSTTFDVLRSCELQTHITQEEISDTSVT